MEQFIHKVSWFSLVYSFSLMFLKTPNIHLFPRVASNWVSYFSFLGRSKDKCVPTCRLFIVSDLTPQISYFLSKIWGRDCLLKIQSLRSFICLSFIFEILIFFMWVVECVICMWVQVSTEALDPLELRLQAILTCMIRCSEPNSKLLQE